MKIKINNYKANEIVKFVRQSGNITQKELALNLNKSIEWIKKIEQGKNKYFFNDFLKICKLCNVEIILKEENESWTKKIDQKLDKIYLEDFIKICKICNTDVIINYPAASSRGITRCFQNSNTIVYIPIHGPDFLHI